MIDFLIKTETGYRIPDITTFDEVGLSMGSSFLTKRHLTLQFLPLELSAKIEPVGSLSSYTIYFQHHNNLTDTNSSYASEIVSKLKKIKNLCIVLADNSYVHRSKIANLFGVNTNIKVNHADRFAIISDVYVGVQLTKRIISL